MTAQGTSTSRELVEAMRGHHDAGRTEEPLELARAAWAARPAGDPLEGDDLAELGEVWRNAMLAASRAGSMSTERLLWRARALSAVVRAGDQNGAAMLMLPTFFEAASEGAPSAELLSILESMRLLARDGGPTPKEAVISTCHEKEGYYLTLEAEALPAADVEDRAERFADAIGHYEAALGVELFDRRRAKIRAAMTSTSYLAATDTAGRRAAVTALQGVIQWIEEHAVPAGDIVSIAQENIGRMAQDRRDLLPYEIT